MNYMNLDTVTEHCKQLAMDAGAAIMEIYAKDFNVAYKSDNSPLTQADCVSNQIILAGLRAKYPNCAILSEESTDDRSRLTAEYCFIVDPLDGTKEFVKRTGEFTVNIALARNGSVVSGVIYAPVKDELYWACEDVGFFRQKSGQGAESLRVSGRLDNLRFVGSKSHSGEHETALLRQKDELIGSVVSAGSSIKGCMVASNEADVYYRFGLTCEWDTAAMQCLVEQAGGIFMRMDGTPMRYNRENTLNEGGFFAVNRSDNIWIQEGI